jgi:iron complex transport system substrate-binding protein
MDEIATMLGLKNNFRRFAKLGADQRGAGHPAESRLYCHVDHVPEGAPNPVEEILSRKGWEDITAIKNKAIYNADTNSSALMHPGPRLAEAAQELYHFVYGN